MKLSRAGASEGIRAGGRWRRCVRAAERRRASRSSAIPRAVPAAAGAYAEDTEEAQSPFRTARYLLWAATIHLVSRLGSNQRTSGCEADGKSVLRRLCWSNWTNWTHL